MGESKGEHAQRQKKQRKIASKHSNKEVMQETENKNPKITTKVKKSTNPKIVKKKQDAKITQVESEGEGKKFRDQERYNTKKANKK